MVINIVRFQTIPSTLRFGLFPGYLLFVGGLVVLVPGDEIFPVFGVEIMFVSFSPRECIKWKLFI